MSNTKAIAQYYLDLNDAGRLAAFLDDLEKAYNDLSVKIHTLEVQYEEEKRKSIRIDLRSTRNGESMIPWTEIIIVLVVLSGLAWWGIRQIDAYTTPKQREHDEQAAQSKRFEDTEGR